MRAWCNYSQVSGMEPSRSIVSLSVACGGGAADLSSPFLSSPLLLAHTGDKSNAASLSTYQKLIVFIFNEH